MNPNYDGTTCPKCDSIHITGEGVEIGRSAAGQELFCNECAASWNNVYALEGISTLIIDEDLYSGSDYDYLPLRLDPTATDYEKLGDELISIFGLSKNSEGRILLQDGWADKTPEGVGRVIHRVMNDIFEAAGKEIRK